MTDSRKAEDLAVSGIDGAEAEHLSVSEGAVVSRNKNKIRETKEFLPEDLPAEELSPAGKALRLADGVRALPITNAEAIALAQVYATIALAEALKEQQ